MSNLLSVLRLVGRLAFWLLLSVFLVVRYLLPAMLRKRQAREPVRRVLVISSTDLFGDAIIRGAFIKLLRLKFPDSQLCVATNDHVARHYASLYREHGDADRLLQYPLELYANPGQLVRFFASVAKGRFDLVVLVPYLTYDSLADWFMLAFFRLVGIPRRIGYRVENSRRPGFLSACVTLNPVSQNWYDMVLAYARALHLDTGSLPAALVPFVYTGEKHEARRWMSRVAVHVAGGARVNRRWPLESYIRICASLCQQGCEVVLLGGAGDAQETGSVVQSVVQAIPGAHIVDLAGSDLAQTIAVLHQSDVFVGNDSGPMHLAAALGVPLVAIFGPSDLRLYRPDRLDARHTVIVANCPGRQDRLVLFRDAGEDCDCALRYDPAAPAYPFCLRQISPQRVLDAVTGKL